MNIVNKLTLRHMKQNKRRTLVTILGVIISVAMITAVATIGLSFLDLLKRDSIERHGEWHLNYEGFTADQLPTLEASKYADKLIVEHDEGFAYLEALGLEAKKMKPYIHVRGYNAEAFEQLPITLVEGRLPQKVGEIVVPVHFIKQYGESDKWLGKEISLQLGQRYTNDPTNTQGKIFDQQWPVFVTEEDQTVNEELVNLQTHDYIIVGITERMNYEYVSSPGYSFISYIEEEELPADAIIKAKLYSAKPDKQIFDEGERLKLAIGSPYYDYNSDILRYHFLSNHDGFIVTLYSLLGIIIGVIMVGSISLIYNAFGISVADRSRYLGMLASVGATKRQKRNSVFFEGLLISIFSIPIGIGAALLGLWITFESINPLLMDTLSVKAGLIVRVNIWTIIISIAISLLTILLSVWWPAKRAAKVSAIDAIRQTQDVKLSRRQVKTSKLTRKLFGIEAEIAMKNIKRNKRRYQITIFSLVISIVLFMTVSYLTDAMKNGLYGASAGINYDLMVHVDIGNETDSKQDIEEKVKIILGLDGITEYNDVYTADIQTSVPAAYLPESLQRALVDGDLQEEYGLSVLMFALDDDKLTELAVQAGVAPEKLMNSDQPQALLYNVASYYSKAEKRYVSDQSLNLNGELSLPLIDYVRGEEITVDGEIQYVYEPQEIGEIKLLAGVETAPIGVSRGGEYGPGRITLLVSKQTFENIEGLNYPYRQIYIKTDQAMELEQQIRDQTNINYITNHYRNQQEEKGVFLIISVFSYGFISLITLISVANILNTISTGIQLRKREFAMLRSIGMTEKGFYRMINYESILYGVKSLLYGLPISFLIMWLIYRSMMSTSYFAFEVPWLSLLIVFVALFIVISFSMLYSGSKVKKGSIVEAIKSENI